ncbi:MAG TPA: hypothetical protein VFT62_07480 [Mycobacteriales bacterium]|nr:hypothetical protein [Mycobacteriales bacterium]
MSRLRLRCAAVAATGTVLLVSACGGGSSGSNQTPKQELVSSVSAVGTSDALTTTLRLETTAAKLQALARAGGDSLSRSAADAIASAQLVLSAKGSGNSRTFALRGIDGGSTLLELRSVGGTLYLRADLQRGFAIAHKQNILANLRAEAAHLPNFVKAFVAGRWVSLSSDAAAAIAGQVGGGTSASPSAGPKLLNDLRDALSKDVTVRRMGSDSRGDHLALSGNARTLALDAEAAVATSVPGGSVLTEKASAKDVPSRIVHLDAWVKDGALHVLSLDLAQFAKPGEVPAGTTLPITMTFEQTAADISAPGGATPVDLTQLGTLLGALGGM